MATGYWIERSGLVNYINFIDEDDHTDVNIAATSSIDIEYKGLPADVTLATTGLDHHVTSLVMWEVLKVLYTSVNNKLGFSLAHENTKSQRKLLAKSKNLSGFNIQIKQYDY